MKGCICYGCLWSHWDYAEGCLERSEHVNKNGTASNNKMTIKNKEEGLNEGA